MKIICITGIDGSGKSTLSHMLVDELRNRSIRASYVYGRTYPVLSRLLMAGGRLIFLRKDDPWNNYAGYSNEKKEKMKSPFLRWGYSMAIWFDYLIQVWAKLVIKTPGNRIIVIDRYLYDTVISDLSVHLGMDGNQTLQIINKGFHFLPLPAITFLMDLPEEIAFSRKNDVPHIDYLKERRYLYQYLNERPEVVELNGANELEITMTKILDNLNLQEIL